MRITPTKRVAVHTSVPYVIRKMISYIKEVDPKRITFVTRVVLPTCAPYVE